METYTAQRRTAVHEAGHAVMAYLLRRPFTTITVIADDDSYGRVQHAWPGSWFEPDIEMNSRTRAYIQDHVMICLAGAEVEEHWIRRVQEPPADWKDRLKVGCAHDMQVARDLAWYACGGSGEETSAYIEWLRQRVLNKVGRLDAVISENEHPNVAARARNGDKRFWALVDALADAVVEAGTLRWRQARNVLQAADPLLAAVTAAAVRNWMTSVSSARKPSTENGA